MDDAFWQRCINSQPILHHPNSSSRFQYTITSYLGIYIIIYFLSFVLFPSLTGIRVISLVKTVVMVCAVWLSSPPASLEGLSLSFLWENFALIFLWLKKPLEHTFPVLFWMKSHCGRVLPFCILYAYKTHLEHPRITIYKPIITEIWVSCFSLIRPVPQLVWGFLLILLKLSYISKNHPFHHSVPVLSLSIKNSSLLMQWYVLQKYVRFRFGVLSRQFPLKCNS